MYFFFTDPNRLTAANPSASNVSDYWFGPVGPANTSFRTTSIHKATNDPGGANPPAFAITSGTILVVAAGVSRHNNTTGAQVVNVILKPDYQPPRSLGLPDLRYFIYRGILSSSVFQGSQPISFAPPLGGIGVGPLLQHLALTKLILLVYHLRMILLGRYLPPIQVLLVTKCGTKF